MPRYKLKELSPHPNIRSLTLGVFDGVHLGHQAVLCKTRSLASDPAQAAVITFEPHPLAVIDPPKAPPRLTTEDQKITLIRKLGIPNVWVILFDSELRETSPLTFMEELHRIFPNLSFLVVGPDWRFGKGAEGNMAFLLEFSKRYRFCVCPVEPVHCEGAPINSTRIRQAIAERDFGLAERLLGRPYFIEGVVVPGAHRGTLLGIHTANLTEIQQLTPPPGVYACLVRLPDGSQWRAVANYGRRPTFEREGKPLWEVHLIGFEGNLYGRRVQVGDFRFLREERAFSSAEELVQAIREDIKRACQGNQS